MFFHSDNENCENNIFHSLRTPLYYQNINIIIIIIDIEFIFTRHPLS